MLLSRLCAVFVSIRASKSQLPLSLKSAMSIRGPVHTNATLHVGRCVHGVANTHTVTCLPTSQRRLPRGQGGSQFQVRVPLFPALQASSVFSARGVALRRRVSFTARYLYRLRLASFVHASTTIHISKHKNSSTNNLTMLRM